MNMQSAFELVAQELNKAMNKFPTWPTDPIHANAIKQEEDGELTKEVVQIVYEPWKTTKELLRKEAIHSAAMGIRFLMSIDNYQFDVASKQHIQGSILGETAIPVYDDPVKEGGK